MTWILYVNYGLVISQGTSSYQALDSCLKLRQSSLDKEWQDFCTWIYYTGTRAITGKYFSFSDKINELQPTDKLEFYQKENYSSFLEAYQICFVRVIFPSNELLVTADTADFILTNLNTNGIINQAPSPRIQHVLSIDNKEFLNSNNIFNYKYWYSCASQSEYADYQIFLYSVAHTKNISGAYPQPFSLTSN